jgi:hypothetical protein
MEVIVSKLAYSKLFLHLAKYPHSSCNGVLLSRKVNNNKIEYVDCIPLFHSSLSLAPGVEIALSQIDAYCEQNDLEIGGYYHANENVNDNTLLFKFLDNSNSTLTNFIFYIGIIKLFTS